MIEYESSWRNSFLDGTNNEPIPKKGRKFIGSMTSLKKADNFIKRDISLDTVMGIMSRLIGDQRKLYQARQEEYGTYYFKDIEPFVSFNDEPSFTHETTYLRNMMGSTDQNSFTGMLKTNDPIFSSDYSAEFWGILFLDFTELCDFIMTGRFVEKGHELSPVSIMARLEEIKKSKPKEDEGDLTKVRHLLEGEFEKYKGLNNKGLVLILPLYCSALYLQMNRLAQKYNMDSARSPRGGISGISNNGFTPKDFMNKYTTGNKKMIWGNPYKREEFVKGEGKVAHFMTKARGTLAINIDIDRKKAKELQAMIENAGVSSFYLGKKGLAYVSKIRL